jgi:hypothetical protein
MCTGTVSNGWSVVTHWPTAAGPVCCAAGAEAIFLRAFAGAVPFFPLAVSAVPGMMAREVRQRRRKR